MCITILITLHFFSLCIDIHFGFEQTHFAKLTTVLDFPSLYCDTDKLLNFVDTYDCFTSPFVRML
jgi:hypothetical protein